MMCYKDITFCKYSDCNKFDSCHRALNDQVKKDAIEWWGSVDVPLCFFSDKPDCYEAIND